MEVPHLIKKEKVSDLIACYKELLTDTPENILSKRYNAIDLAAGIELKTKGVTIDQLQLFNMKRDAKLVKAQRGKL